MPKFRISLLVGSLALTLAACGDEAEEVAPVAEETQAVAEFDPMTRDYTLSEDAQTRRAEFDEAAFQEEYGTFRDDIVGERVRTGMNADENTDPAELEAASQPRDPGTNMRARQNMTWGYLDQNSDGQLSVAEYAIWAIPLDPTAPARNDENAPHLNSDQANKAADSFFYYDQDGDTYLSQQEFNSARRGGTIEATPTSAG